MHCIACDKLLNDFESTRKQIRKDGKIEYLDLCNSCFKNSGLSKIANIVERIDLIHETDLDEDNYDEYSPCSE